MFIWERLLLLVSKATVMVLVHPSSPLEEEEEEEGGAAHLRAQNVPPGTDEVAHEWPRATSAAGSYSPSPSH